VRAIDVRRAVEVDVDDGRRPRFRHQPYPIQRVIWWPSGSAITRGSRLQILLAVL
jgi:hypothetical protein